MPSHNLSICKKNVTGFLKYDLFYKGTKHDFAKLKQSITPDTNRNITACIHREVAHVL